MDPDKQWEDQLREQASLPGTGYGNVLNVNGAVRASSWEESSKNLHEAEKPTYPLWWLPRLPVRRPDRFLPRPTQPRGVSFP
jgi:hypothetical protein